LFQDEFSVGFFVFHGLGSREELTVHSKGERRRLNTPTWPGQAPNTEAGALRAQRNEKRRQGFRRGASRAL
jgi:hypothetical protein